MLGAGVIIIAVGLLSSPYPTPARTVPSAWQTAAAALLRHPADDAALAELERLSTVLRDPETGEPERDVTTAAPSVVAALQAAVQARPDDARPRRLLGLTLLAAGLPRAAVVKLRRAGDPSDLTLALLRAARPEEVLDLPALRDPQPGNAALLIARGRAFEMLRRYDDAAAALRQASAADPADPNPVARLGLLLLWQGDREGALRALRTATALDPQARATLRLSAEYAYATRDFAASAAAYDRLIALGAPERYDPIPPSLGKARALLYQGDLQRAATVLDQTRLPRDDPPVGYYRALLAFRAATSPRRANMLGRWSCGGATSRPFIS